MTRRNGLHHSRDRSPQHRSRASSVASSIGHPRDTRHRGHRDNRKAHPYHYSSRASTSGGKDTSRTPARSRHHRSARRSARSSPGKHRRSPSHTGSSCSYSNSPDPNPRHGDRRLRWHDGERPRADKRPRSEVEGSHREDSLSRSPHGYGSSRGRRLEAQTSPGHQIRHLARHPPSLYLPPDRLSHLPVGPEPDYVHLGRPQDPVCRQHQNPWHPPQQARDG